MVAWTLSQEARDKWAREVAAQLTPAELDRAIRVLLMIANIDSVWNPLRYR
jgi:hypothetical protein